MLKTPPKSLNSCASLTNHIHNECFHFSHHIYIFYYQQKSFIRDHRIQVVVLKTAPSTVIIIVLLIAMFTMLFNKIDQLSSSSFSTNFKKDTAVVI